ncbi:MAG: hypothetical protein AB1730_03715 [Myxococcota bacterium]
MHGLLVVLLAATAPAPDTGYEERLITWALETHGRVLEPNPDGKRIEEVLIVQEDIFAPSDPYPLFLNVFHKRTRESVIRREVLLDEGDAWEPSRALETERNLRRLFVLAVVKVVPVKGKGGGVGLMVVTKDRWSLRLTNSFTLIGSLLQYLALELVEVNFNGWGQRVSVNLVLRLDTVSIGQSFIERRLFGSRLYVGETASIVLNRQTGRPEGTSGSVSFGSPLITLDQRWGGLLTASWNVRKRRVFRGANIWQLPYPDESGSETVPYVYDARELTTEASGTRSFGRAIKVDLTAALGGYVRQYAAPTESMLSRAQAAWLNDNYLPRSENVTYLSAFARAFPSDFQVLRNVDTYQLSEDYQLGWLVQGGARWAVPLFTPNHFVELAAAVRYRFLKAGDLFTVALAGGVRLRPGQSPANQRVAAEVVNYSPEFSGGRFVARVLVDFKWNDLDNRQLLLGGSTGLRGAYPDELSGRQMVLGNLEYRARAFELWTTWVGVVLFYDVGSAFDAKPVFVHTTGVGFRILLPQLNREVLRIDFGFVINGPNPGPDRLNASWGQVTDIRPAFLDDPL